MIYLDFDLKIEAGSGGVYPVAVLASPAGQAREVMRFPFDTMALDNHLLKLQNALLRSGETRRKSLSPEEEAVQHFGRSLFEALFVGEVGSLYRESVRMAKREGKGLRLKLRIAPPDLAALPWEFLNDPRGDYLCLSPDTPIVRYPEVPHPGQEPLAVTLPLRILGMVASPHDQRALNVEEEKQRLETALAPLQARGLVELEWLPGQTWRELQAALRRGGWHVFHFIGHGGFDRAADEGFLALADERGNTHRFHAGQLARLLTGTQTLRFALLNACEGAKGSQHDLVSSTAAALVHRGLPGVLAMQYDITDHAAIELSRTFYEALAEGLPVDFSVTEGRRAICFADARSFEWGIPVLYLRAADGILFELQQGYQTDRSTPAPSHPDHKGEIATLHQALLDAESRSLWETMIEVGEKILKLDSQHEATRTKTANAYDRRSVSYHEKGDYERAIIDTNRAIELDPSRPDFYCSRGLSYYMKRDYERAIADTKRAIELDPSRPDFYYSQGLSYHAKGDYERAIVNHTLAVGLDPSRADFYSRPDFYYARGLSYHAKADYEGAIVDYSRAIELAPSRASFYYWRGVSYHAKGDYEGAIADYNRAIELDPTCADFYVYRGLSYKLQGNRALARKDFGKAAALGHQGAKTELKDFG